ncbi:MAG: hypothetical protein ACJ790_12175 [Myxococcaceae bacterium]
MTETPCPELEQLFNDLEAGHGPALDHSKGCEACKALLEEHRQLEKDLYRLADPLPPPDLVHKVMAAVAKQPRPLGAEVRVGLTILLAAGLLAVLSLLGTGVGAGTFGTQLASYLIDARAVIAAVGRALLSLWQAAGIAVASGSLVVLVVSLLSLRKLSQSPAAREAQV